MIHATPAIVSTLAADKLEGDEQGNLLTSNGTRVVSGDGYIGARPDGQAAVSAGTGWMFATGPVNVYTGPVAITSVSQSLDRSDNILTFRAERYVLAVFDGALQAGILVDWTP